MHPTNYTDLVTGKALDPAFLQRRDHAALRANVDNFGFRVSKVEPQEQVIESRGRTIVLFDPFGLPTLFQVLLQLLTKCGREHEGLHSII